MHSFLPSNYRTSGKIGELYNRFSQEILVFLFVLIVVFSSIKLNTGPGSQSDVEQWINLTNQLFYGNQDFLFSYGPLFWLSGRTTSQYNPYTYWLTISFLSILFACFWSIIFTLSSKARAYIFFAGAYFLFFQNLVFATALFLWPFAIVAYLEFSQTNRITLKSWGALALGCLIGLSFYIRFFYGMVGLATFGSYLVILLLEERRIPKLMAFIAGLAASYIFFGLLIFHNKISLFSYFKINSQLNFGNSVDMTLDVRNSISSLIAAAFIVIFLNIYLLLKKRRFLLTINILLLIFLKIGFSRTDHYIEYFVKPVAILTLIMVFEAGKLGRLLFILVAACLFYISAVPSYLGAPTLNPLIPGENFKISYVDRLRSVYAEFRLNQDMLSKIKDEKIDVYPYNNEYAFANGLNYWHRPLFQNYMTLTPKLDSMNQKFFESKERPKYILWTSAIMCSHPNCNPFDNIDQKYLLNEDPLTTSSILLNYHAIEKAKGKNGTPVVLFEENGEYTPYSSMLISEQTMRFGEWYKTPQIESGVLKITPKFNFTVYGRIKNLLFRGGILKIKYRLLSGEILEYRLNILNSENGVWVSPLPNHLEFSGPAIDSIMFESISPNYFQSTFLAKWTNVPIPGMHVKNGIFDSIETPQPEFTDETQTNCDGYIDNINGAPPTQLTINKRVIKVQGWLAFSAKDGILADKIFLTLTDSDGHRLFMSTHEQDRKDVANAFGYPRLSAAGYESLIDLSTLKGNYHLGLAGLRGTQLVSCGQYQIPLVLTRN